MGDDETLPSDGTYRCDLCHVCRPATDFSGERSEVVEHLAEFHKIPDQRIERYIETETQTTDHDTGGETDGLPASDRQREYWVEYTEDAGWGGKTKNAFATVECDSVTVSHDLVRFLDRDGNDVWTIRADRVLEYKERSFKTATTASDHDTTAGAGGETQ